MLNFLINRISSVLLSFCCLLSFENSFAQLRVDITSGNPRPVPIAITEFFGVDSSASKLGNSIGLVISNDLEGSGLFKLIDHKAFIQSRESLRRLPQFPAWRQINAQALVVGTVENLENGKLRVDFRLWDVFSSKQLIGRRLETEPDNWRRVAHIISDAIYKRITGEDGYFDTRIVYVSETGPAKKRVKRLAIMDQDGANLRYLTNGSNLVLTPRFSPTAQEITYLAYVNNRPRVYIYNIDTGQKEALGDFPGMSFAPRFSPDGNKVIMSIAKNGNSDIYTMDLPTRRTIRLTAHPAIDTSPSFAPDGSRIVFNSDRGGQQQLYVMTLRDRKASRISFGTGRYATPVWSPRGDLIAFTKMFKGEFAIGVMRPDGSGERLLTKGFLVESPTWAPNGRVLMFFRKDRSGKQGGQPKLFSIDLTGYNERLILTPTSASDPAWSPVN